MGKQSKKKKASSRKDKAAYKEKIQERRERAYESAIAQVNPSTEEGSVEWYTLIPGDRVWFFDDYTRDESDPHTYRGILRAIGGDRGNGDVVCLVQPISNYLNEDPTTL
jgi:hypothetical protein